MGTTSALATAASQQGTSPSGVPLWLVCGLVFIAILVCTCLALFGPAYRADRARRQARLVEVSRYRLIGAMGQEEAPVESDPVENAMTTRALGLLDKLVRARGQRGRMVSELDRSGLRIRPEEWAAIQIASVVAGGVGLALVMGVLGFIVGAIAGWGVCRMFIKHKITKRARAFEEQLPDSLQLLAGSLRSGFALNQALAGVVREGVEPIAGEFGRAVTEVRLGADLADALDAVAERMNSYDMALVVMAIRTAREVGGNLAEVLGNTISTMRERVQLRGQVRVLSAEGRLSAWVLTGLPIGLALYLMAFKPGYLNALFSGVGLVLLIAGIVLLGIGTFWMRKLVKIEV